VIPAFPAWDHRSKRPKEEFFPARRWVDLMIYPRVDMQAERDVSALNPE